MKLLHNAQKKLANATSGVLIRRGVYCCVVALAPSMVLGQTLSDPTRPPAGFIDPDTAKGGSSGGDALPAVVPDPEAGLILQSVLLPKTGKPVAVIGGRYVPLGGNVDGWELVRVNEREAVIARGAERRTLKMTPLVTKTPVLASPVASNSTLKKSVKPVKKTSKSKPTKVSCNDETKPK